MRLETGALSDVYRDGYAPVRGMALHAQLTGVHQMVKV